MRSNARLAACVIIALALFTLWLTPRGNLFPEPRVSDFAQFLSRGFYVAFLALGLSFAVFGRLPKNESRGQRFLFVLAIAVLAVGIETLFEKLMWDPRPRKILIPGRSSGFPSGHATCAFAVACLISVLFPRWRWAAFAGAFLVGYSRVETTSHYPHQVWMGAIFGSGVSLGVLGWRRNFLKKQLAKTKPS